MHHRRLFWGIALGLYAGLIFYLSSRPFPAGTPLFRFRYSDKLLHFLEYIIFGLLAWQAFLPRDARGLALTLLIACGYAGSDELHQAFVPTRTASIFDWLADAGGIIAGVALLHFRASARVFDDDKTSSP